MLWCLCHAHQRGLRPGQPECHRHGAVEHHSGGQLGTGLFSPPHLAMEGAEAEITVSQKRAHAEFLSQGAGLPMVLFGLRDLNGVAMDEAVAEKPVCPGLVASFLVLLGESESPCGKLPGILQAARREASLSRATEIT